MWSLSNVDWVWFTCRIQEEAWMPWRNFCWWQKGVRLQRQNINWVHTLVIHKVHVSVTLQATCPWWSSVAGQSFHQWYVSVCVLHQSRMRWVSARFSFQNYGFLNMCTWFIIFTASKYNLIKPATYQKICAGHFSMSFYCHILLFFQCSSILLIQMTGRWVPR